jgi:N-acetylglucosaminyldiphosphoundecaprenol N-acetyl-beta-D-mannosaminyltransferase
MKISILGSDIHATSYLQVVHLVSNWAQASQSCFICAANVHMLMEAYDSPAYQRVLNQADMVTPDGMPLVWMMRLKGIKDQSRVYGPTLMLHVLNMAARENISVGFYGSDEQILERLVTRMQERFPALMVVYAYSPPFRDLSAQENSEILEKIVSSGVRILFVGLGCPKQEKWMAEQKGKIPAVLLGVGAAFDFHAGTKRQSPPMLQKMGLEWFFRLIQEPKRLWKRYLYHNPRFIFLAISDLLGFLQTNPK